MKSVSSNALDKLHSLEINMVQEMGCLHVFGLKWSGWSSLDYATLDEALLDKIVEVSELHEAGRIPTIKVENKSQRMVFLMAGELLVGCKQDRVLNTSMMIPRKAQMPVSVACVESGRWSYKSRRFRSVQTSSHSYLRMILSKESAARYKAKGAPGSDQGAVWSEVARKMRSMGSTSRSGALQDMFESYDEKLNQILDNFSAPKGCHGAAFATNGEILGVDLFDKPTTFSKLWSKLVKSYAVDALEEVIEDRKVLQPGFVLEWIKSALCGEQEWFDSPGLGQDVRIEGDRLIGAALIAERQLVHLQLFQKENTNSIDKIRTALNMRTDPVILPSDEGSIWRRFWRSFS